MFTGLVPGNYYATVKDANGVTSSLFATVYDRCPTLTLTSTNEDCIRNNGTITATATKGTAPYSYSIDGINFQNNNVFSGLPAGTYTVTLKDALGFTSTSTIQVKYYCLSVSTSATNAVCGNKNGSITATALSGTPPYKYSIDGVNFQSMNVFTGLDAATYTVTVKDILGHTATTIATITSTSGPQIVVGTTPASCLSNDGTITITGNGGTSPLVYSIDGLNYQPNGIFSNVVSGSYTASVKDANGCRALTPVAVVVNCPTITGIITNESCGQTDGTIVVSVSNNGFGPYQYSLDGVNFQNGYLFTGLGAGTYTITVKDALGYLHIATSTINNNCPVVTASVTNACSNANGSIIATGANGATPYQYSIDGIHFQSNNLFTGLPAATYTVTVKDNMGSTNTTKAIIINVPNPQIIVDNTSPSCMNNDGIIKISALGGTNPVQYSIDGISFQNNNVFANNIGAGPYKATIRDANGCVASQPVNVVVADNLILKTGLGTTICEGEDIVLPALSNGTSFIWSPATSLNHSSQLNPVATPSITTKYYVTANLGICSQTDSIIIAVNPAPIAFAGHNQSICYGQGTQLSGSGGSTYKWTPSTYLDNPNILNPTVTKPQASITYNLNVTDNNSCQSLQSSSVSITVTPTAKVFAGNDTVAVLNQPFQLIARDLNNSGFVNYVWSPAFGLSNSLIQNPIVITAHDIKYNVTATTQNGCEATDEITIKVYKGPAIYVPTAFTPNDDGRNDILRAIPVGIKELKYFIIYNRWGQQVFYTTDPRKGWDGRFENVMQPIGSFVWMAQGIDDNATIINLKGTVNLIR